MDIGEHFSSIGDKGLAWGQLVFDDLFAHRDTLSWSKQGSLLCTGDGQQRIGFAARLCWCSLHFRMKEAIALYVAMGGVCETSAVTIKIHHDREYDAELIGQIVTKVIEHSD